MSTLDEDRVYARHPRRRGAVLIIGAGAVGGFVAEELAAMGISPLWLVDKDVLEDHNLVRHPLGAEDLGQSKAVALAERIHLARPWCTVTGRHADFLELSETEQRWLVDQADVVVAATDEADCQRQVNAVCLAAEKPAVYPAVWVDRRVRDAEVGEILWVLPGRHTPCYECWTTFRRGAADTQAGRGARVDIQQVSLATARVVGALLDRRDQRSAILDPDGTAIYVHGLTPTSPGVRRAFPASGLYSRNVHVPFPPTPCVACGAQQGQPTPPARPELPASIQFERGVTNRLGSFFSNPRNVTITVLGGLGIVFLLSFLKVLIAPEPAANPGQEAAPYVESQVESAPSEGSGPAVQSPQVNDAEPAADQSQTGDSAATVYFTMADMTLWCQAVYGDAWATAAVVPTSYEPPGYWVKCLNAAGENMGGLDVNRICNDAYPGAFAVNPDPEAAEAWTRWYCAGT